ILVTGEGVPKLLDFGIAKSLDGDAAHGLTSVSTLRLLTPEYASPEQVRGDPLTTGTDVFGLGVILYKLLSGRSPYRAGPVSFAVEHAVCHQEIEAPSLTVTRTPRPAEGSSEDGT